MEILKQKENINILIDNNQNFKTDLGWGDSFQEYENDVLKDIINPIENYEMDIYKHEIYDNGSFMINDLWIKFNFFNNISFDDNYNFHTFQNHELFTHTEGFINSFFRIEYYKTENNDLPTKLNRRLVSTKVINVIDGELFLDNSFNEYIYMSLFVGSNIKNKYISNFYWFQDNTILKDTLLDNDTFWLSAKFFNAKNGLIYDFTNKEISNEIEESQDMYFKCVIDKSTNTFKIYDINNNRIGLKNSPITFFEKNG